MIYLFKGLERAFQNELTSELKWLAKKMQDNKAYLSTPDEALQDLVVPFSQKALLVHKEAMIEYPTSSLCKISQVWEQSKPSLASMMVAKNSPLLEFLNYEILKIRETGIFNKIAKKYGKQGDTCVPMNEALPIGKNKIIGAQTILGIGGLLAVVFLLLELMWDFRVPSKNSHYRQQNLEITTLWENKIHEMKVIWGPTNRNASDSFEKDLRNMLLKQFPRQARQSVV